MEVQKKELGNRGWEKDKRNGEGKWKKEEIREEGRGRRGKSLNIGSVSH